MPLVMVDQCIKLIFYIIISTIIIWKETIKKEVKVLKKVKKRDKKDKKEKRDKKDKKKRER